MHSKLLLASTFGAAAAFQAPAASKATTSLQAMYNPSSFDDVQSLPGILNPTGFFDPAGLSNDVSASELKRYREAELTHGRVAMVATVGFLVGEQVEGSSFLFDSQVTGPAVNHFQQVPLPFWFAIGTAIAIAESVRVQKGWQDPGQSDKLFLLKDGYQPGDLEFDPLGLGAGKSAEELDELASKELNNGRLAMIAISGMVVQELVDGLNILPADIALELGNGDLAAMERACAGKVDEAACAKAFEASLEAASRM